MEVERKKMASKRSESKL